MKNKKLLLVLQIVLIATLAAGVTFALVYTMNQMNADITTANMEVDFQGDATFSSTKLAPILDEDKDLKAEKFDFSVNSVPENTVSIGYRVALTDLNVASEFKNTYVKWELSNDEGVISDGDFSELGTGTKIVLFESPLELPLASEEADSYTLKLWISESNSDQTGMMGKTISGKITVELIEL